LLSRIERADWRHLSDVVMETTNPPCPEIDLRTWFEEAINGSTPRMGHVALEESITQIEKAGDLLKHVLENRCTPDDFLLASSALTAIRVCARTLKSASIPQSVRAAVKQSGWPNRTMVGPGHSSLAFSIAETGAIAAALASLLLFPSAAFLAAGLLLCHFVVRAYRLKSRLAVPDSLGGSLTGRSISHDCVVDVSSLRLALAEAMVSLDTLCKRQRSIVGELRAMRQKGAEPGAYPMELVKALQGILGAARRDHHSLSDFAGAQASAALDSAGLSPVTFASSGESASHFDIQHDSSGRLTKVVELFPAIVTIVNRRVVCRGRVVLPGAVPDSTTG
jgi:hypothetical protein